MINFAPHDAADHRRLRTGDARRWGLAQLIAGTDQVRLPVTSGERLRLSGERVVEVPPLQVPEIVDNDEMLRRSDAVALFVDRARAAGSGLDLDHVQLKIVAEICRQLDRVGRVRGYSGNSTRAETHGGTVTRADLGG